jgi:hypothetical protein
VHHAAPCREKQQPQALGCALYTLTGNNTLCNACGPTHLQYCVPSHSFWSAHLVRPTSLTHFLPGHTKGAAAPALKQTIVRAWHLSLTNHQHIWTGGSCNYLSSREPKSNQRCACQAFRHTWPAEHQQPCQQRQPARMPQSRQPRHHASGLTYTASHVKTKRVGMCAPPGGSDGCSGGSGGGSGPGAPRLGGARLHLPSRMRSRLTRPSLGCVCAVCVQFELGQAGVRVSACIREGDKTAVDRLADASVWSQSQNDEGSNDPAATVQPLLAEPALRPSTLATCTLPALGGDWLWCYQPCVAVVELLTLERAKGKATRGPWQLPGWRHAK